MKKKGKIQKSKSYDAWHKHDAINLIFKNLKFMLKKLKVWGKNQKLTNYVTKMWYVGEIRIPIPIKH